MPLKDPFAFRGGGNRGEKNGKKKRNGRLPQTPVAFFKA
jgi:hypothetical protein